MTPADNADILENTLRRCGDILDILLTDRTTGKNIIWATDSYKAYGNGKEFSPKMQIKPELVTGQYGKLIQPRATKPREEQKRRTKEKAEVFTPLKVVDQMNKLADWAGDIKVPDKDTWQAYIKELKLEVTCGEGPFIASRYNPTSHTGKVLDLKSRVGFLDRKLHIVSQYCKTPKDWLFWAKEAYKASYGYEWQGDNLLIARENLLYTLIDYYKAQFNRSPTLEVQREFAEIISWNIWQMDGLKYVIPMSCHHEKKTTPPQQTLFPIESGQIDLFQCSGCKTNNPLLHNGRYAKTMDWETGKAVRFLDVLKS